VNFAKALGLCIVVLLPAPGFAESLRVVATLAALPELRSEIEAYRRTHGTYPVSLADLGFGATPVDAWGQPYAYYGGRAEPIIYSLGKNGADDAGKADDVASWESLDRAYYPELGRSPAFWWSLLAAVVAGLIGTAWLIGNRRGRPSNKPMHLTAASGRR